MTFFQEEVESFHYFRLTIDKFDAEIVVNQSTENNDNRRLTQRSQLRDCLKQSEVSSKFQLVFGSVDKISTG